MDDIGKAFDKRFHTNSEGFLSRIQRKGKTSKGKISASFHRRQVQAQRLTDTQRKWMELMFPKNQKQQTLICFLRNVCGKVDCASVRHVDFAPLEEYYSGREGGELSPNEGMMPVVGRWGELKGFIGDGFYRFAWKFTNRNPSNACEIGIDTSVPLHFLSASELVESIVQSVRNADARVLDQLNRDDETIQNELTNSDDKVFLYELLQNANDYPYRGQKVRVEIRLDRDCLCFRHTGREFSALNVNALCSAGAGDKSDNPNAIGYKGIGFKTVFRNNSRVYLKSGEYSFWFDKDRAKREVKINAPWRRVPIWDDVKYSDMGEFRVGFKLYPDRRELLDGTNENGYRCILRRLFKDERVLLFIPELSEVSIQTNDDEKWSVSKRSGSWCVSDLSPVELPDSVKDEIDREVDARNIPPKLKGKEKTLVTFACGLSNRRLLPVENACLYCFLPAERARWGFPFLMNTDMIPTGPRDDVRTDLKLNQMFSRIAGEEFFKWINSLLKCGRYEPDSVFTLIPDFDVCIDKAEIPAVKKFLQEFKLGFESGLERMVLPTNEGRGVPASECVFDETGVLCKFGSSFWGRLNNNRRIVSERLWGCDAFARFVKRYGDRIKIHTFDFADLRESVSSSAQFAKWIQNPMANREFLRILVNAGELKIFNDAPIFLDNHKNIGSAAEMYFYGQGMQLADRYLGAFSGCYRCLSKDSACIEEIGATIKDSFRVFNPRFLIENEIFAAKNRESSLRLACDVTISRNLFAFISYHKTFTSTRKVHCRSSRGRDFQRQESFEVEYFPKQYLGTLPIVLEDDSSISHILDDGYDVFDSTCEGADTSLVQKGWIDPNTVKFINRGYFEGEDGEVVRNLFKSKDLVKPLTLGTDGFGEFFRKEICRHFNKDCADEDLIDFHEYMQRQVAASQLVNTPQFEALKKTPVIVQTKDGVRRLDGCDGVMISPELINVAQEISDGLLPEAAKVLDPRLCSSSEMVKYWHENLGCQILKDKLRLRIEAYVERQHQVPNEISVDEEFKRRHVDFVWAMIRQEVETPCLKGIKLIDSNGRLAAPEDLVLPEVYNPKCHFQKYGCDLNYVSECYSEDADRARVSEYLRNLGVRDEFQAQDVGCLSAESFCRYYWTEYSLSCAPTGDVIDAMKSVPSVLDRLGCVRKPSELYSARLEHPYLTRIGDSNKLLPLCKGVNTEFYEDLNFRDSLTASDAISFLLADSDGLDYQFRGRALSWVADGNLLPEDRERYRNDERALWKNFKNGQMTHVGKLCAIKSHGANRVRAHFGNSELVIDSSNIFNGGQQITKEVVERAFEKLGVALVDNSTLEPMPSGEEEDRCIKIDVKVRLLILLAMSGEENWADAYVKKATVFDSCCFKVCDRIVERCVTFDQLRSEHGKFSEKNGVVYYVGGWQDKHVFLDVVKYLKRKLGLGDQYTDEDLKEAFDTDGGNQKLADRILLGGDRLLRNDTFVQMLKSVSPDVWQVVQLRMDDPNDGLSNEAESIVGQEEVSEGTSRVEEHSAGLSLNTPGADQQTEHEKKKYKIGEYEVDEDEYSRLGKIFVGGDSSDDAETQKKKDESKLACLRLFNQLEAQGFEPSMNGHREIEYVVRELYAGLGKTGPNIDINTGERLHVISAMGGVGYIPPRWWNKVVNNENGTNVICAVTGASKENCVLVRNYSDLLACVGENAIPVKIRGANAEERVHIATNWFSTVNVSSTAGKIYALLKLRDKTAMNTAFSKGFCSDEMSKYEETHNDDL